MQRKLIIFAIASSLFLCSMTSKLAPSICELITTTSKLTKVQFDSRSKLKVNKHSLNLIDVNNYNILFAHPALITDSSYLFGQYEIDKERRAIICYNTKIINSKSFDYFSLHIFDDCKLVQTINLTSINPAHNLYSSLSKNMDTLTVKELIESNSFLNEKSKADTVLINLYKVNLRSPYFDTIYFHSAVKIVDRGDNSAQ